jgi:hypothetical protein
MPSFIYRNAFLSINGVDLSPYVRSLSLPYNAELQDDTGMGDVTRRNKPGLLTWSVDIEFKQDFSAGAVDATMFPLVGADAFPVIIKPKNEAVSATNPQFSGSGVVESYQPLGGSTGDLATAPATIQCAGTLSRATV